VAQANEIKEPYIIGETAYHHEGDIDYLYKMIDAIAELGLDAVKTGKIQDFNYPW